MANGTAVYITVREAGVHVGVLGEIRSCKTGRVLVTTEAYACGLGVAARQAAESLARERGYDVRSDRYSSN